MPATARRYGLAVDAVRDERLDIGKSTRAAARYLSDLHLQFGSWPLALAAYNTGEQHVQRAINRTGSSQLALLNASGLLPLETRNYVPAVLAATRLFDRQLFVTATVPAAPTNRVFATSTQ
jgi:membrane-bound lytic murein transglycosylase D